jgi:hypothetical protein
MCALFVDFRAAFDKVDSVKMFAHMRERKESVNGWCGRSRRYMRKQETR